jgi:hypothetical protein
MSESVKWVKARASGSSGGNCVEVARLPDRARLVRDSKNRAGVVLRFSPGAWRRFADEVKRSLAGPGAGPGGHSRVLRCPFGLSGGGPRGRRGSRPRLVRGSWTLPVGALGCGGCPRLCSWCSS